jgi:hypothetical protein
MRFYYQGLKDATLSYDGTADTDYPITNLQDMNQNTSFKDTVAASGNELSIDLTAARTCAYIALINYTAATAGKATMALYYSDNNVYWTAEFVDEVIDAATRTNKVLTFTSSSHRYWKIKIFDGTVGGETIAVDIPVILLGTVLTPSHNPEMDMGWRNEFNVGINETPNGIRYGYSENETRRKIWELSYRYLTAADKTALETMADEIVAGELSKYPFLYYDDSTYHWVRLRGGINFKTSAYQAYDTTLILEQEF